MPNETKFLDRTKSKGTRMYLIVGRGNGKSMIQMEIYRRLLELSDNKQSDMVPKITKDLIDWEETEI